MKHLVIAPHPDDETLGAGGTLLRMKDLGHSIHWCIVTRAYSRETKSFIFTKEHAKILTNVSSAYGFDSVHELAFPTTQLDKIAKGDLVSAISKVILEVQPTTIYLPFWSDAHSDHAVVFEAAWSCCKVFRYPSVKKILCMEIPSETDFSPAFVKSQFIPSLYVNISASPAGGNSRSYLEKKKSILKLFHTELGEHPFPRSLRGVEALATLRGAASGCEYAEAFMLIKEIFS